MLFGLHHWQQAGEDSQAVAEAKTHFPQTVSVISGLCQFLPLLHQRQQPGGSVPHPTYLLFHPFLLDPSGRLSLHWSQKTLHFCSHSDSACPLMPVHSGGGCYWHWVGGSPFPTLRPRPKSSSLHLLFLPPIPHWAQLQSWELWVACCEARLGRVEILALGGRTSLFCLDWP